jgi:hypothetical protein
MLKCYTDDDDFQTFTKPFVIYDYQFSDIGNLTKLAKAGTAFSSSNLIGEYDNKTVYV